VINTALPPVRLEPGWYWYHVERSRSTLTTWIKSEQQKAWEQFSEDNAAVIKVRKQFAGDTSKAVVYVFELVAPIAWTLPGVPSKAPRKAQTELKDLSSSQAVKASPDLQQLVAEAGATTGSALKLIVWGGAAVLLFNLFRRTAPEPVAEES
jgi:hypothetical protein